MDTTPSHPVRTDLLSSPFGDLSAGTHIDLKAYVSELPSGCDSGRHRHLYPTVVYVLEGLFRFEEGEQGETVTEYKAGEVFSEKAGVVVRGVRSSRRGCSSSSPTSVASPKASCCRAPRRFALSQPGHAGWRGASCSVIEAQGGRHALDTRPPPDGVEVFGGGGFGRSSRLLRRSEHRPLDVGAEDLAEAGVDLAEGGARPNQLDRHRHQVGRRVARVLLEAIEQDDWAPKRSFMISAQNRPMDLSRGNSAG